jgi:replication factor C subunit 3/5
VIEKYTKNARFCLICNYVSKIIPALQSRCTRFRFAPLNEAQVSERVKHIAELEKCVFLFFMEPIPLALRS